mmetsp:Transcript_35692/g.63104  ORF Transcript_35692/g.63104 Transcript_35692/m.63104 type:complete len:212 (+) Transcript_35692:21-656(+)
MESEELGCVVGYYAEHAACTCQPLNKQRPGFNSGITFVAAGAGQLAGAPAPKDSVMSEWVKKGATFVVTLVKKDKEKALFEEVQAQVEALGLQDCWLHAPINGIRNSLGSLRCAADIAELLQKPGVSVVVHCAQGKHRTGTMCYLILRHLGLNPEDALRSILEMRPVCHSELTAPNACREGSLWAMAERLFTEKLQNSREDMSVEASRPAN